MGMILGVLIGTLLDPIRALVGLGFGYSRKPWGQLIMVALLVSVVVEFLLSTIQLTREFDPIMFGIGVLAVLIWMLLGRGFRKLKTGRRVRNLKDD